MKKTNAERINIKIGKKCLTRKRKRVEYAARLLGWFIKNLRRQTVWAL